MGMCCNPQCHLPDRHRVERSNPIVAVRERAMCIMWESRSCICNIIVIQQHRVNMVFSGDPIVMYV
eukprot:scaffold13782_cov125-Skeletonema_dohrnii-CCMP3373.AAC.2